MLMVNLRLEISYQISRDYWITSISEKQKSTEIDENSNLEKILGMNFNKVSKKILNITKNPTKKPVLKTVMSVYHPLGMLSPIITKVKIIPQKI